MTPGETPHFHNEPGVPEIRVRVKEFMCVGAPPPEDHPHVFLDMGSSDDIICPYCATRFVYDPNLKTSCEPAECDWDAVAVRRAPAAVGSPAPLIQPMVTGAAAASPGDRLIIASFGTKTALLDALEVLRGRRIGVAETYTPAAMDEVAEDSPSPLSMAIAGFAAVAAGFAMQAYANVVGYPLDIGGRPEFSWPAFVPIAFEIGVLFAILTGFVGFFFLAGMGRLHEPIDESDAMRRAMRDEWALVIRAGAEQRPSEIRALLRGLDPKRIEEAPA